jgi:hypothetical protein
MAKIGRWSGININIVPALDVWSAPIELFIDEDRNDSNEYSIDSSTSTITLPSSELADGYLIVARIKYASTLNNRCNFGGRLNLVSGSGDFNTNPTGGYSRDTTNNEIYINTSAIYNNPSSGSQVSFEWIRDSANGTPTGAVAVASIDIIPLYYSNISMYSDTLIDGTTGSTNSYTGESPNLMSLKNTVVETTSEIFRSDDTVTLSGRNKRYLIMSGYYSEGRNGRTQRWLANSYNGTVARSAMGYMYFRNSTCGYMGTTLIDIIEVTDTDVTVELNLWRGDGTDPTSLGGAQVDGGIPTYTDTRLTIIELTDSTEILKSENVNNQTICVVGSINDVSLVDTNLINDSNSFSPTVSSVSRYDIKSSMDAFVGANISAAYPASSGTRNTGQAFLEIDDATDVKLFHGNFARGAQGNQNCFGYSANPFGFAALQENQTMGFVSNGVGSSGVIQTNPGWAGMYGFNLDTMQETISTMKFYIIS